jgi:hypothetical protein
VLATHFPGKTPSQVKDVWRKVVAPKLARGEALGVSSG